MRGSNVNQSIVMVAQGRANSVPVYFKSGLQVPHHPSYQHSLREAVQHCRSSFVREEVFFERWNSYSPNLPPWKSVLNNFLSKHFQHCTKKNLKFSGPFCAFSIKLTMCSHMFLFESPMLKTVRPDNFQVDTRARPEPNCPSPNPTRARK